MRRTAAEAEQTRAAIIRAALHRFATDGWDGCSLVDVARDAGVTRGAVYHHFTGKKELLTAVLDEEWVRQTHSLFTILSEEDAPVRDRMTRFLSGYLRKLSTDEAFRELAVVSIVVAPQALPLSLGLEDKQDGRESWNDQLRAILDQAGSELRTSKSASLFTLNSLINGSTLLAAATPDGLPSRGQWTPIAQSITAGLLRNAQ